MSLFPGWEPQKNSSSPSPTHPQTRQSHTGACESTPPASTTERKRQHTMASSLCISLSGWCWCCPVLLYCWRATDRRAPTDRWDRKALQRKKKQEKERKNSSNETSPYSSSSVLRGAAQGCSHPTGARGVCSPPTAGVSEHHAETRRERERERGGGVWSL